MVRKRSTEKTADDFIDAAEKDASWKQEETPAAINKVAKTQAVEMPADTKDRVKARAKASLKRGIYTIQATESQKALMNYAAEQLDISKAKLMERYFFTALEAEFGAEVPITKEV